MNLGELKMVSEGGGHMDASERPKQSEDYHLFSEGQSVLPKSNLGRCDQLLICQIG